MKSLIVIPARFGSSRFPGKPLAIIAGQSMLQRVCNVALKVAAEVPNTQALVATDDERILQHAQDLGVQAIMTPKDCATGTDRILKAIDSLPPSERPEVVVNLQGDTPLTPDFVLKKLLKALSNTANSVVTPVVQLPWHELDSLIQAKQTAPFSGTTVIVNEQDEALWFSKTIIPAIRTEDALRKTEVLSPVFRHLGIYGYQTEMLELYAKLPKGKYEQLEGLEQLRLLEHGFKIKVIKLNAAVLPLWRGVDTKEDANFIENMLLKQNNIA